MSLFVLYCVEDRPSLPIHRRFDWITASLRSEFAMTDIGNLHFFLGITVTRDSYGMHLS
jgi:hypothetical protein